MYIDIHMYTHIHSIYSHTYTYWQHELYWLYLCESFRIQIKSLYSRVYFTIAFILYFFQKPEEKNTIRTTASVPPCHTRAVPGSCVRSSIITDGVTFFVFVSHIIRGTVVKVKSTYISPHPHLSGPVPFTSTTGPRTIRPRHPIGPSAVTMVPCQSISTPNDFYGESKADQE